ncbi:Similar to Phospholipid:diacylglycerol acyltransferase; acc. no. O94680 [Pyronema omphalodes CBS 100304]|nr:Similar to Phospholipid:diacylglycerol acyltransferase; acc. no. O94680 [Pyronema omphalodes CBS 100304]
MIVRSRTEPIPPAFDHNHESTTPPPATPSPEHSDTNSEKQQQQQDPPRRKKRSTWLIFTIGGLAGLFLAGFTAKNQDMLRLELLQDLNLDTIIDIIPAGILKEASDITMREKEAVNYDAFSTGLALKAEGLEVVHPVVMVPGVISTGLESWGTEEKSRPYFRKRLWGSWSMLRAMITGMSPSKSRLCRHANVSRSRKLEESKLIPHLQQHIMLDKYHGLDPEGVKLRAAMGFDATDFFVTGYWIWSKILENLASIGYDPTSAYTASYDWRLAYLNLEVRDQYFSRLKSHIEIAHKIQGKKVALVAHSMGSQVAHYFFKWVEAEGHGDGGPTWVNDHIAAFINISGCMLGAIKGLPAVLSGEMRDTVQLNPVAVYGLEKFFGRQERAEINKAMPGISSMLPKGGEAIWGNLTWAPDDDEHQEISYGSTLKFADRGSGNSTFGPSPQNMTVTESLQFLLDHSDDWYATQVRGNYSHGVAHTVEEIERNQRIPNKWVNPLESRLPLAPDMKIYCFYGVGKPTERSYFIRPVEDPTSNLSVVIDASINGQGSDHGVILGEGDGTVPLMSSGYMCSKGWKLKRYNPAGVQVKTVELLHLPQTFDIRGGPTTADHVDILGRPELNELILRVVAGKGDEIAEVVHSNIREYAAKVPIFDEEVPSKEGKEGFMEDLKGAAKETVERMVEKVKADIKDLNEEAKERVHRVEEALRDFNDRKEDVREGIKSRIFGSPTTLAAPAAETELKEQKEQTAAAETTETAETPETAEATPKIAIQNASDAPNRPADSDDTTSSAVHEQKAADPISDPAEPIDVAASVEAAKEKAGDDTMEDPARAPEKSEAGTSQEKPADGTETVKLDEPEKLAENTEAVKAEEAEEKGEGAEGVKEDAGEVKDEAKEEPNEEPKEEPKENPSASIHSESKTESKMDTPHLNSASDELKSELKHKLEADIMADINTEIKKDVEEEVEKVIADLKEELMEGVKHDVETEVEARLRVKVEELGQEVKGEGEVKVVGIKDEL